METKIILIPIIGAIIGLMTNWIAVKMLFHPRKKIFGVQGVIPKRKNDIAKRIGEISPMMLPDSFNKIKDIRLVGKRIHSKLEGYFVKGVENKIRYFDNDQLEEIVMKISKKELRFIVWAGGIIGFLVGCVQAVIVVV